MYNIGYAWDTKTLLLLVFTYGFFPLYFDGRIGLIKLFSARTDIALVTGPPNRGHEKKIKKNTIYAKESTTAVQWRQRCVGEGWRGIGFEEEATKK